MSKITTYVVGTIRKGENIEKINCGLELDPIVPILFALKTGELSLQEAYDPYILYKHKGYI